MEQPGNMEVSLVIVFLLLGACVVAFVSVFNRMIAARNACRNARGSIDANLKKRHDLVPNLVRVVKAYAAHEREVLHLVAAARRDAMAALGSHSSATDEGRLTQALFDLNARVEAYPELKADEEFHHLGRVLTELEEQISASRRAFNAHVMAMNNLIEQFPTLIVARIIGFRAFDFFSAGEDARHAPATSLGATHAR